MASKKRIVVTVDERTSEALAVLGSGDASAALAELASRAVDGVTRPGSWERPWLEQAFGSEWQDELEPDPSASWRQRPKTDRRTGTGG